jgi:uncharacterized protein DUF4350
MPGVLASSDRKLLIVTSIVLLVLVILVSLVSPQATQRAETSPSSYASDSGGALAAYSLLQEMHRSVTRWEESPTELPHDRDDSVLILADPLQTPAESERAALLQFVKEGGRILFTGPGAGAFFKDVETSEPGAGSELATFEANVPSGFTRNAPKISMRQEAEWDELTDSQLALYGDAASPVVVSWRIGKGTIFWWAGATPLTNAGLLNENNLEFFLDAVSDPAAATNDQPQIYWDEYFHGERSSLSAYIGKTPLPWGILQIAIIGIAVIFTFSRRSGPIAMPAVVSRLSPLEFVDTLAGLYQRAHAEPAVVGIVYQRLRTGLSRQLRLSSAGSSDTELGQAVTQRLGANGADFVRTMQRAAAASRATTIPAAEAFTIVTSLEDYDEQFGLKRRKSQEKF